MTPTALLEGWSDAGRWTIHLAGPSEVRELSWPRAGEWRELVGGLEPGEPWPVPDDAPFAGGWFGFITYDASSVALGGELWADTPPEPPVWFARFDRGILVDPRGRRYVVGDETETDAVSSDEPPLHSAVSDSLEGRYAAAVESIRCAIAAGDVYQVNLTRSFGVTGAHDPLALYRLLTEPEAPQSSVLLRTADWSLVSASPEVLLVHDRRTGLAESRPIKGTIATGDDADSSARRLLSSAKDASEHLMIVDLVRNDLGTIARRGSVHVSESRALRRVGNIVHLESTIRGDAGDASIADVLRALLPAGSITGAPKRRAVSAIRALEPVPRGVYTGAIGFIDNRGRSRFSVAIRTAVVDREAVRYHAGGGIVWDSDADLEDAESRLKAERFLRWSGAW